jgi:tRNA nucleotidyltransferase (CCA-adding enzyme)
MGHAHRVQVRDVGGEPGQRTGEQVTEIRWPSRRLSSEDGPMRPTEPEALLARLRTIPALLPVLQLLGPNFAPRVLLVGGAVRDLLLGDEPQDLDLVVEGSVARVATVLGGRVHSHDRFATATVSSELGRIDIAQARTESYRQPGALPDIEPATIAEDLRRRDFTVNAMAIPLSTSSVGTLLVVPGAIEDLEQRRLSVLHDRSFIDDPTRLLRLARYSARLGFDVAPHTLALKDQAREAAAFTTVSGTRIGNELRLLAAEPDPVSAFAALRDLGLDTSIEPGFGLADDDRLIHDALAVLPADGRRDLLALAVAARHVPSSELWRLLDRLAFPAPDRQRIIDIATRADDLASRLERTHSPYAIAEVVGAAQPETIALASALADSAARQNALRWLTELRQRLPDISGDDLIAHGIAPGPAVGAGLDAAKRALLDEDADRDRQLELALEAARRSSDVDETDTERLP